MEYYDFRRFRRLRHNPIVRDMVRETRLHRSDLIYPLFVIHGSNIKNPVASMPGVYQMSVENTVEECKQIRDMGIPAVILFGIPEKKDATGSDCYSEEGIIQTAIRAIKKEVSDLVIISDICLCEYTSHGHCGVLDGEKILNDKTVDILAKSALTHVEAGTDMIAPSDMMDGRVLAIRETLDDNGYKDIPIMSYAAKYASGYYGPFRDAAEGAPKFGDRKSHQMDIGNQNEAIREAEEDVFEGADIIMVKPAMAYLDVIYRVKRELEVPTAAYQVSGEYSMIKAASEKGWLDHDKVMLESLNAIKRAGADMILTYFAKDVVKFL